MKRITRNSITAAESTSTDQLNDKISEVEDAFEYAIMGAEYLGTQGKEEQAKALNILNTLHTHIQTTISDLANNKV